MPEVPKPVKSFGEICSAIQGAYWLWGLFGAVVMAALSTFLQAPAWAILLFSIAGLLVVMGVVALWQIYQLSHAKSGTEVARARTFEPFPIEGYTSIKEAATTLYDLFPHKYILERAKKELETNLKFVLIDSVKEPLRLAAKYIETKIPLHGEDSLSGVFGRIVDMNMMRFNDDLTKLTHALYDKSPNGSYVKIAVKSDEFNAFIEEEGMHHGNETESAKN